MTKEPLSNCCKAQIKVAGTDGETRFWVCSGCHKACMPLYPEVGVKSDSANIAQTGWEDRFDNLFEDAIIVDGTIHTDKNGWVIGTHYPDDKDGGNIKKQITAFIRSERQALKQSFLGMLVDEHDPWCPGLTDPLPCPCTCNYDQKNQFKAELKEKIGKL